MNKMTSQQQQQQQQQQQLAAAAKRQKMTRDASARTTLDVSDYFSGETGRPAVLDMRYPVQSPSPESTWVRIVASRNLATLLQGYPAWSIARTPAQRTPSATASTTPRSASRAAAWRTGCDLPCPSRTLCEPEPLVSLVPNAVRVQPAAGHSWSYWSWMLGSYAVIPRSSFVPLCCRRRHMWPAYFSAAMG